MPPCAPPPPPRAPAPPQSTALPGWTGTVGSTIVLLPAVDVTRVSAEHKHSLTVPAGASALRATTNWGNPALDLDMYVYGSNRTQSRPAASTYRAPRRIKALLTRT